MSIIKSFSVGSGDMFYIRHNADSFSIIDCCLSETDKQKILKELKNQSQEKSIIRFISTHPDDDHIRGLEYLNQEMPILNFYCVENKATKRDRSNDFEQYCFLRGSNKVFYLEKDCRRRWLNDSGDGIKGSGITILWPITSNEYYKSALQQAANGGSPNNISPIIKYSLESGVTMLWMGDLETDFMENIGGSFLLEEVDILFAPHHGRDSGKIPRSWLNILKPKIIVIGEAPSGYLNYYSLYNTIKQNSAGALLFDCVGNVVRVYVQSPTYAEDFLVYERHLVGINYGLFYTGTLFL